MEKWVSHEVLNDSQKEAVQILPVLSIIFCSFIREAEVYALKFSVNICPKS